MQARYHVIFSGHVQGVGFRYTVRNVASKFPVTGFVQNLSDGTVLLVIEGELEELDQAIAAIRERMADFINNVELKRENPQGEFAGFKIHG